MKSQDREVSADGDAAGEADAAGSDEIEAETATTVIPPGDDVEVLAPAATEGSTAGAALAVEDAEPAERALVPFDSLQRYLSEIRRYPLLSREEEHELAVRYKEHQELDAAYQLVTANLRLVVMVAREYQRTFRNILDLIQEGNIGLMEAVKNYDPYRGVRFPSYAVWWFSAYIIRYVMNNWRMVKIGTTQAQRKLFFNLQKEKDRLQAEGFNAEPKLLAQRLDVKESEVIEMEQRLSGRDVSVDATVGDSDDATLLDFLPSGEATAEDQVAGAESRAIVARKIQEFGGRLEGKDRIIFFERMVAEEPQTLQDLGDRFGVSRERVRQIEERLKRRLKAYLLAEVDGLEDAVADIIR